MKIELSNEEVSRILGEWCIEKHRLAGPYCVRVRVTFGDGKCTIEAKPVAECTEDHPHDGEVRVVREPLTTPPPR